MMNADPERRYFVQTDEKRKDWIQSLEGRQVFPRSLSVEQVGSIEEIAHALAGKFRFTCQTQQRYSVAEHCVRGSLLLPPAFAGAFLLHELSEVYLPDVAGPLKAFVFVEVKTGRDVNVSPPGFEPTWQAGSESIRWSELERRHTHTMLEALRLLSLEPLLTSPEVKAMDWAMLAAEKRDLCGPEPAPWGLPHEPAPVDLRYIWTPEQAAAEFIKRFRELFGDSYGAAASTPPADIPS